MTALLDGRSLVFLDACCLLNLAASGRFSRVLDALPARFGVARAAWEEVLYLDGTGEEGDREPVDLKPFLAPGFLQITQPETEQETAGYVDFAAHLDDGEAMTCALARARGGAVATDDRKALRLLRSLEPPVPALTTSVLLKNWADEISPSPSDLKRVLTDVERRGRFRPGRTDPLFEWWEAAVR